MCGRHAVPCWFLPAALVDCLPARWPPRVPRHSATQNCWRKLGKITRQPWRGSLPSLIAPCHTLTVRSEPSMAPHAVRTPSPPSAPPRSPRSSGVVLAHGVPQGDEVGERGGDGRAWARKRARCTSGSEAHRPATAPLTERRHEAAPGLPPPLPEFRSNYPLSECRGTRGGPPSSNYPRGSSEEPMCIARDSAPTHTSLHGSHRLHHHEE